MSNVNSTIADKIKDAANSGQEAKFISDGVTYEFTPTGLSTFIQLAFTTLPTSNPGPGLLWRNSGVITVGT